MFGLSMRTAMWIIVVRFHGEVGTEVGTDVGTEVVRLLAFFNPKTVTYTCYREFAFPWLCVLTTNISKYEPVFLTNIASH